MTDEYLDKARKLLEAKFGFDFLPWFREYRKTQEYIEARDVLILVQVDPEDEEIRSELDYAALDWTLILCLGGAFRAGQNRSGEF